MTQLAAAWLTDPAPQAVMQALDGQAFYVGGCVRNALLGAGATDIDVATPLTPDVATRRLIDAGLKVVPTGIDHGTVTAVHAQGTIEVTTFRADVETDGRRAVVAFTEDMATDAQRRDFTINALYARMDGTLVDPLGGLPDLRARRVRFIGDATERIREDYLRILRFFRFHALYGWQDGAPVGIDAEGLAACAALIDGIDGLARERIGTEFRKLLAAPDPAPATASMAACGALLRCLPGASADLLAPVVHTEQSAAMEPHWPTRLTAICAAMDIDEIGERLRLSRAEARQMQAIRLALDADESASVAAYRHGVDAARAAAIVRAAAIGIGLAPSLETDLAFGASRSLPIRANDLTAAGFAPGPRIGAALKRAEAAWIQSGFQLDKAALLGIVAN